MFKDVNFGGITRKIGLGYRLQAVGARLLFFLVRRLSLDTASALGGWLGRAIGPRLGISNWARRNLRRAFPKKTEAEIEVIVRGMWDNLLRTAMEYPHIDRIRIYEDSRFQVVGAKNVDLLCGDGKSVIFFSGHLANWELMAPSLTQRGAPLHLVYRAPNNPLTDWLFNHRLSWNVGLIPKGKAGSKRLLSLLSQGGNIGMLVDQKMNDGISVPFFGREAMTAPVLARFGLKYGCPIVPTRIERLGGARFRITAFSPLEIENSGNQQADILKIMTQVNRMLEGWIRERPDQWLWLHHRWPD